MHMFTGIITRRCYNLDGTYQYTGTAFSYIALQRAPSHWNFRQLCMHPLPYEGESAFDCNLYLAKTDLIVNVTRTLRRRI